MLKIPVAALNITSLTDARYFAAFGVDWLGFNVNPESDFFIDAEVIAEIISWVEGPKFLLHEIEDLKQVEQLLSDEKFTISGIHSTNAEIIPKSDSVLNIFSFDESAKADVYILLSSKYQTQRNSIQTIYFQYDGDMSLVEDLVNGNGVNGLCITANKENEVGLKSFEDLDPIFDLLY